MNLVGIHAKLGRVEHHISEMTNAADRLCADARQSIVREVHEDCDEQVWIYRGETPKAPVEWSVIIGEILYNLRSALDQLVWQLVLANGQVPGRHNEFPITKDHRRWEETNGGLLKGISRRHEAMIGYLQPYTGGMNLPFDVSMLGILNDLGNVEKHRHLLVTVIASKGIGPIDFGVDHPELDDSVERLPLKGLDFLGKVETGKVLLPFNNPDTAIDASFQIDVCFGDIEQSRARAQPVLPTLDRCLCAVKGSVDFLTTPLGDGFVEAQSRP